MVKDGSKMTQENDKKRYFNDKWWISPFNYDDKLLETFNLPENKKVYVRDSTIREGEETPGVLYTIEEKINIVEKLEEIGVEHIDCGYIGKVQDQWDLANKIKEIGLKMKTYCHLSTNPISWNEEIKKALEAKVDFIGFGIVLTEWQLQLFTGKKEVTPDIMVGLIRPTLRKIKKFGGTTILDCVDATRSDMSILQQAIKEGVKGGVKMIMLYDTVGACNIPAISHMIKKIKPISGTIPLGIHVHDDFGLGTASTIAAVEQGVTYLDLVVNKLGDRGGNTSFEEVVVALEMLYGIDTGIDLTKLYELSKYIEKISGIPLPYNKPVVGRNTFLHESELHVMSALDAEKYWMCFTPYKPECVGQEERLIFGPTTLHGEALRMLCEGLGYNDFENFIPQILEDLRTIIIERKFASKEELIQIIQKYVKE
ncbi:MAG: hypothetical protein GY870_18470 [archaeon]|nr:hypothetical protein [archaeon]